MDYSKMSDFEINSAVARSFGLADFLFFKVDEEICSGPVWEVGSGNTYNGVLCSKGNPFDPCNNPADAWSIITEHNISVVPYRHTLPQAWPTAFGMVSKFTTEDKNPLRAAMIVFLKMQESAK